MLFSQQTPTCGLLLPWNFSALFSMTEPITTDTIAAVAEPFIRRAVDIEKVTHVRIFNEHFGVTPWVTACVWNRLVHHDIVPSKAYPKHLLWALLFFKVYSTEHVHCSICQTTPETYRNWVRAMMVALNQLELYVVS